MFVQDTAGYNRRLDCLVSFWVERFTVLFAQRRAKV